MQKASLNREAFAGQERGRLLLEYTLYFARDCSACWQSRPMPLLAGPFSFVA
jgi:hypothetical protein